MRTVPRELWTETDALTAAELMLDPQTNGGLPDFGFTADDLVPRLLAMPYPAWLIRDGARLLCVSASPNPLDASQLFLHFANRGFAAREIAPQLAAFMEAYPAQWFAFTARPALARLLGGLRFLPVSRTPDLHLFKKE